MTAKIAVLAVLLGVMCGCQENYAPTPIASKNITYFRDSATGLCFASVNSVNTYGSVTSIATVPCEKVTGHLTGEN